MNIGLDTRNVGRPGGTGIATYATTLAEACELAGHSPRWVQDSMDASTRPHAMEHRLSRLIRSLHPVSRLTADPAGYIGKDLYRTAEIRDRLRSGKSPLKIESRHAPSIMHWTCPLPIIWPDIPNIVTIHDLIPLLRPDLCNINPYIIRKRIEICCANSTAIVTISESVRQDIISHLSVPAEKVINLSQSVSLPQRLLNEAHETPRLCEPGGFLYFGLLDRRKNIGRLIKAHGISGSRRPLVLIGAQGLGASEELAPLADHPAPERVHIFPWCTRPSLIRAISEARCVVFPSLAEGFGLPIAEAMVIGTPVITSRGHATEEIAGGAALLVDPYDIADLAGAMNSVDHDDASVVQLRALGRKRAQAFTMESYSKRLATFYDLIAQQQF